MSGDKSLLQFETLQSAVDTTFWEKLKDLKLDQLGLSEEPLPLQGWYSSSSGSGVPPALHVNQGSFEAAGPIAQNGLRQEGTIHNVNSLDAFKSFDRSQAAHQAACQIWQGILSGKALEQPADLNRFLLLTYADLKHYTFTYWFSFIALKPPAPFTSSPAVSLAIAFGESTSSIVQACNAFEAAGPDGGQPKQRQPFWLIVMSTGHAPACQPLAEWGRLLAEMSEDSAGGASAGGSPEVLLACADAGSAPAHPAWPLRNVLLAAAATLQLRRVRVVCLRQRGGKTSTDASFLLDITLPEIPAGWCRGEGEAPAALGWEAGRSGKAGPRQVDLREAMDPVRQADSAADLNLKLMKWRAAPSLDLARLASTKCLLLGAGTLGCAVARTLLGWGVRDITLVDNSRVSYSNPVRQSLYTFADCAGGGRPKAEAAAEALKAVLPSANVRGVHLSVPMPGHLISEGEEAGMRRDAVQLEALIRGHDAVFLLLDTREARWLPTLLAASAGKLAINAALGFDSYLVMRHGSPPLPARPEADLASFASAAGSGSFAGAVTAAAAAEAASLQDSGAAQQHAAPAEAALSDGSGDGAASTQQGSGEQQQQPGNLEHPGAVAGRLGCYFCNDVVAPLDSTAGRALDQQCTVARPGLAPIAGALAVELLAAALQAEAVDESALGPPAHMLRGQLSGFGQMALTGAAFSQCTACSPAVVGALRTGGWPWLLSALREPKMLEELTGLAAMHAAAELADLDMEACGDSEDGDEWTTL